MDNAQSFPDIIAFLVVNLEVRVIVKEGQSQIKFANEIEANLTDKSSVDDVISFFLNSSYNTNYHFLLALLLFVDQNLSTKYDHIDINKLVPYTTSIKPLNDNLVEDILVYPQNDQSFIDLINNMYKKELRKKYYYNPINELLSNHMVIYTNQLMDFKVSVTRYSDKGLLERIRTNEEIKFLFFPFTKEEINKAFKFVPNDQDGSFKIKKSKDQKKAIYKRFFESLKHINTNEYYPDIILFPEMYLTEEITKDMDSEILNIPFKQSFLLVAGTLWKDNKNVCYIYNHSGDKIITQEKYTPFKHEDEKTGMKYVEDIPFSDEHTINIIDIDSVGKFAFYICKDMINIEYVNMLKLLDVDMVLIPTYTPSKDVMSQAKNLSEAFRSVVVFLNSCAVSKENIVGSITTPDKEGKSRAARTLNIKSDKCDLVKCESNCSGIEYIYKFDKVHKNK